jgi:hypothetical protein
MPYGTLEVVLVDAKDLHDTAFLCISLSFSLSLSLSLSLKNEFWPGCMHGCFLLHHL